GRAPDAAAGTRACQLREAAPLPAQMQVGEDRVALHPDAPAILGLQAVAGIGGVFIAYAQVAADAEAHVLANGTILPARAAAAGGAGVALGAEIVIETQWTELCQRRIGCQQQGDAEPHRVHACRACLRRSRAACGWIRHVGLIPGSGRQRHWPGAVACLACRQRNGARWGPGPDLPEAAGSGPAARVRLRSPV